MEEEHNLIVVVFFQALSRMTLETSRDNPLCNSRNHKNIKHLENKQFLEELNEHPKKPF